LAPVNTAFDATLAVETRSTAHLLLFGAHLWHFGRIPYRIWALRYAKQKLCSDDFVCNQCVVLTKCAKTAPYWTVLEAKMNQKGEHCALQSRRTNRQSRA